MQAGCSAYHPVLLATLVTYSSHSRPCSSAAGGESDGLEGDRPRRLATNLVSPAVDSHLKCCNC